MKLAILADFHLGYERFPDDAFKQALDAVASASAEADAILLAGDLFDTKVPKPESIAQALTILRIPLEKHWLTRIASFSARDGRQNLCNIPVIAIHGTHEMRVKSLLNPIQVLEKGGFLINAHAATVTLEKDGERVAVTGMGGVPEKQAQAAIEALNPAPVDGAFNIFLFHQSLQELLPVTDEYLSVDDLPSGFDLYVCGHMHGRFFKNLNGKQLLIPGSTVITQFKKEEEESKGFFIFDTKTRDCSFHAINSRPFFYREVELKDASEDDAVEKVRDALRSVLASNLRNPIIRVKVKGTLRKGITSSSISFSKVIEEFSGVAFVSIDKAFESYELVEKIREFRSLREGASVRELGLELLEEKLKRNGFSLKLDIREIFELLSNAKHNAADLVIDELLKSEPTQQVQNMDSS